MEDQHGGEKAMAVPNGTEGSLEGNNNLAPIAAENQSHISLLPDLNELPLTDEMMVDQQDLNAITDGLIISPDLVTSTFKEGVGVDVLTSDVAVPANCTIMSQHVSMPARLNVNSPSAAAPFSSSYGRFGFGEMEGGRALSASSIMKDKQIVLEGVLEDRWQPLSDCSAAVTNHWELTLGPDPFNLLPIIEGNFQKKEEAT